MNNELILEIFTDFTCGGGESCLERLEEHLSGKEIDSSQLQGELLAMYMVLSPEVRVAADDAIGSGIFSWYYLYLKYERDLDFKKATLCLTKALEFLPRNVFLLERTAAIADRASETEIAANAYIRLHRLVPKSLPYNKSLIKALYLNGQYKEALDQCKHYPVREKDQDIQLVAGYCLFRLGKLQSAQSILENIPQKEKLPTFQEVQARTPKPQTYLEGIQKGTLNGKDTAVRRNLGFAYLFHGQYKDAQTIFVSLKQELTAGQTQQIA